MPVRISSLAEVSPKAHLGVGVEIGPFCLIGPDVTIGAGCKLESHVTIVGHSTIGARNRFFANCVIGGEPQDVGYKDAPTRVEIGDDNCFREGVTVNRGAQKEDHCTRIGNGNLLMSNAHVAHNCRLYDNVILVNGVLLGGHVHVHDKAIISGNCVVHHYSTVGTLAFVSGGCRVPHDIPPYMLSAGSDNPTIKTINIVGMRRNGITERSIRHVKQAFRLLYREHRKVDEVRELLRDELAGTSARELGILINFLELQQQGKLGRAREVFRDAAVPEAPCEVQSKAA